MPMNARMTTEKGVAAVVGQVKANVLLIHMKKISSEEMWTSGEESLVEKHDLNSINDFFDY